MASHDLSTRQRACARSSFNAWRFRVSIGFQDLNAAIRGTYGLLHPERFTALVSDPKDAIRRRLAHSAAAPRPKLPS